MSRRSSASARRSPTPLRNLTGVSSRRRGIGAREELPSAGRWLVLVGHQLLGEPARGEDLEVVDLLTGAEEPDRQRELPPERHHGAALRGAVELGDHEPGGRHRPGGELPPLPASPRRLSCGAPGALRPMTRTTLRSSSIRPSWVWSRPAVSMITIVAPR